MRERVCEVLKEVNEDIVEYEGENLLKDGIIDSFEVLDIVSELEDTFNIEIGAKHVIDKNFKSVDAITALVTELVNQ